jgi:hypothetical protein
MVTLRPKGAPAIAYAPVLGAGAPSSVVDSKVKLPLNAVPKAIVPPKC